MQSVSERAAAATWTCQVVPRAGRLLDMEQLRRAVRWASQQFSLRGVEATVAGQLIRYHGRPAVLLWGTGEVLPLGALRRKVQWDPQRRKDQPPTDEERRAYGRLLQQWHGQTKAIRIIGPLAEQAAGHPPILEVRDFSWDG